MSKYITITNANANGNGNGNGNGMKKKKKNGIVDKLQKSLLLGRKSNSNVKEGHFAVLAVDTEEPNKRFVVPLNYLTHPTFLKLLEQAAEEYGFDHQGALTIPCRPSELERILLHPTSSKTMLQIC